MKKWKKFLAGLLSASMLLGLLCACDSAEKPSESPDGPDATGTPAVVDQEYPITPEELGSGEAKWSEEKTADGWMKVTNDGGETLGYSPDSGVKLIQVAGFAFKDLNKNGKLDLYEDWRQEDGERAADLAERLTYQECFGLMMYSDIFTMEDDGSVAYDNNQAHSIYEKMDEGVFSFLSFANSYPSVTIAKMNNNGQAYAESLKYGIPMNVSNNPQNFGGPSNLALGATFDPKLAGEVAALRAKQYRAIGVFTELGPSIEIAAEPRWTRISGTYGEDPALSRDMANAIISAYQSTYDENGKDLGWGADSIVGMMKHFPGDGAGEGGRESHSEVGAYNVYPGDQFETSLIPFIDGGLNLDSSTNQSAAVMLSMSIAYSDDESLGELVGSSHSKYKLDVLRETYGYDGLICTDWLFDAKGFGTDDWTLAERRYRMVSIGVDMIGGDTDPAAYEEVWPMLVEELGEDGALKRLQDSARRILRTFFNVSGFENPYVATSETNVISGNSENEAVMEEANLKSIVMVKNEDGAIAKNAGGDKPTVYIPMLYTPTVQGYMFATYASWDLPVDLKTAENYFNVVTDTVTDPTGEPDADGNPTYTANDIVRASAGQLAECDFALVIVNGPATTSGYDNATGEYVPITLQYGEYTANSTGVRSESISGKMVEGSLETPYGTQTVMTKENRSYYGKSATSTYTHDLDAILYTAENMPESADVIVAVNTNNAFCVYEFENQVDAILLGFGIDNTLFLEVAAGQVEPSGLLPFQMPKDMAAVEAQYEDVPRDMECYVDAAGNTYDFGFGLNWSGVIKDARTEKYCVPALTEPAAKPVS